MRTLILGLMLFALMLPVSAQEKAAADPWSATVLHWREGGRKNFHVEFESLTIQNSRLRFQFDHFTGGRLTGFEQYWINYKLPPVKLDWATLQVSPGVIYTNRDQLLGGADFNLTFPKVNVSITQRSYLGGTDKHLTFVRFIPLKLGDVRAGIIWHMNSKSIRAPDSYLGPSIAVGKAFRLEYGRSLTHNRGYFYGLNYNQSF